MTPDEDDELEAFDTAQEPVEDEAEDLGDPVVVKKRNKKLKISQRDTDSFWERVLADPVGRREVWAILNDLCEFKSSAMWKASPIGFPDAEATEFSRGQRWVGERLFWSLLAADRNGTLQMLDEFDPQFIKSKKAR